jgi:60 kDa SS-A/Ro ribonucleoprotein
VIEMVKLNKSQAVRTHEGAKGRAFAPEQQLRRALMNCMLWEDQFYEDGVAIAERIGALVPKVKAERVAQMAVEAREDMKLRHAPLLIVREMARHETHRGLVAETLENVIQRPDELTEFLATRTPSRRTRRRRRSGSSWSTASLQRPTPGKSRSRAGQTRRRRSSG